MLFIVIVVLLYGCDKHDPSYALNKKLEKHRSELQALVEGGSVSHEVGEALLVLGRVDEGIDMLENLRANGDDIAYYKLAVYKSEGLIIPRDKLYAEKALAELCESYIEPCSRLGALYRGEGKLKEAEKAFLKSADSHDIWAVSSLYEIYSDSTWEGYNPKAADYWNAKYKQAKEFGEDSLNSLTKHSREGVSLN
ncbi:hypothetical protein [Teredinibacter sp. KSP-S5-2]|uniref:hypothetical protein n=1 Tax=Teredinibacter sp. KSP-S5-2 TaxID=3034506 RepID=UPI002934878D|nr:hypothetical protein [Teredinibacter sp. KSP-S5-2]WNO09536.1 hypothetical protein P5V12_21595 [Teredinibacter sp. KSP-S5-2]